MGASPKPLLKALAPRPEARYGATMRHAIVLSPGLFLLLAAALTSCGGSASETPWPVEPEPSQLAPAGENVTPPSITDDHPDAGRSRKP
jgi:hypothetical protein